MTWIFGLLLFVLLPTHDEIRICWHWDLIWKWMNLSQFFLCFILLFIGDFWHIFPILIRIFSVFVSKMCKYFSVWSFVVIVWCTICKQTQTNLGHNCHLLMQNPKCYLLFFFLFDAIIVLLRLCLVSQAICLVFRQKNRRNHHVWHDRHSTLKLGKTNQTPQIGNRR